MFLLLVKLTSFWWVCEFRSDPMLLLEGLVTNLHAECGAREVKRRARSKTVVAQSCKGVIAFFIQWPSHSL